MTVIAWDGHTLAADKQSNFGDSVLTTTKIERIGELLVGAAGHTGQCRAARAWVRNGRKADEFKGLDDVHLLVIEPDGRTLLYDESPHPIVLADRCVAIGSAMGEAMVAMACGKCAREAVELAIRFNTSCGNGVDTLELA